MLSTLCSTKGNHFTAEDESAFRLFAIYCALALHYSRIYNMLVHSKFKYKVNILQKETHKKQQQKIRYVWECIFPIYINTFANRNLK